MEPTNRNPALDGARAVAVLLVILCHVIRPTVFPGGAVGVDIFFVLSGYLITGILLSEAKATGDIRIGRFLLRRALRLMPPLVLLLSVVAIVGPFLWPDAPVALAVIVSALYLTDYVSALYGVLPILGHTWSLSVEEHFYLVWPVAVLGLVRLSPRGQIAALALAFVVATLWRLANAWWSDSYEFTALRFDTRVSGLILGALLAVSRLRFDQARADIIGVASIVALVGLIAIYSQSALYLAFLQPLIDMAALGLIASLTCAGSLPSRLLAWRPAAYVGLISYSVYLWHYPIAVTIRHAFSEDWRVILAGTLALSLPLAALSWVFIEAPVRAFRRRLVAAPANRIAISCSETPPTAG